MLKEYNIKNMDIYGIWNEDNIPRACFKTCIDILHAMMRGKSHRVQMYGRDFSGLGYIINCFYLTIISPPLEQNIAYGLLCLAVDVALPCEATLPCWVMDDISYYNPIEFLWVIHKASPLKGDWIKELDFKLRGKGYTIRPEQLPNIQEYILTILA